ncbi:MAG: hypothetical protein DRJ41_01365 [Thermoprotei archaeon]|nr:MAG: hypothetical protein DRJ41_01365 [Thermoprotei archaeon]
MMNYKALLISLLLIICISSYPSLELNTLKPFLERLLGRTHFYHFPLLNITAVRVHLYVIGENYNLTPVTISISSYEGSLMVEGQGKVVFPAKEKTPYRITLRLGNFSFEGIFLILDKVAIIEHEKVWMGDEFLDIYFEFLEILNKAYDKLVEIRGSNTEYYGVTVLRADIYGPLLPHSIIYPLPLEWPISKEGYFRMRGSIMIIDVDKSGARVELLNRLYLPGSHFYDVYMDTHIFLSPYFHEMAHLVLDPIIKLSGKLNVEEAFAVLLEIELFRLLGYKAEYVNAYGNLSAFFNHYVGDDYGRIGELAKREDIGFAILAHILHDLIGHEEWVEEKIRSKVGLEVKNLAKDYGFDLIKRYFRIISSEKPPRGLNEDEVFVYFLSLAAGEDLSQLFKSWGFNITQHLLGRKIEE